ncbi:MAG: uncharacterized protein KVP18_003152 [Porospora cf. gigantea A]|uniref:uncharacterized protein n=1 Tax=Porospora cf. gigantea A TaxID=2853593 RepID=UPI00355AC0AA|nr:MAG: hypothetical protein KVP18_003152 [Porospora cf. gigantea A]
MEVPSIDINEVTLDVLHCDFVAQLLEVTSTAHQTPSAHCISTRLIIHVIHLVRCLLFACDLRQIWRKLAPETEEGVFLESLIGALNTGIGLPALVELSVLITDLMYLVAVNGVTFQRAWVKRLLHRTNALRRILESQREPEAADSTLFHDAHQRILFIREAASRVKSRKPLNALNLWEFSSASAGMTRAHKDLPESMFPAFRYRPTTMIVESLTASQARPSLGRPWTEGGASAAATIDDMWKEHMLHRDPRLAPCETCWRCLRSSRQLTYCSRCLVPRFCSEECEREYQPLHARNCEVWARPPMAIVISSIGMEEALPARSLHLRKISSLLLCSGFPKRRARGTELDLSLILTCIKTGTIDTRKSDTTSVSTHDIFLARTKRPDFTFFPVMIHQPTNYYYGSWSV